MTAIGVGKTFNMAGFAISTIAIPNKELRERFQVIYDRIHFAEGSVLSHVAFESAYTNGKEWIKELKVHLYKNYTDLRLLCKKYSEYIELTPIEGTYLAWLNCRGMMISDKELRRFFVEEARLGLNAGLSFSREGSGFMRLNFAVSSAKMSEILERLEDALKSRRSTNGY
jgi:cystathionine beta-lyase